jgi:hypothetical protein
MHLQILALNRLESSPLQSQPLETMKLQLQLNGQVADPQAPWGSSGTQPNWVDELRAEVEKPLQSLLPPPTDPPPPQ